MQSETENPEQKRQVWGPWATVGFGLLIGIVLLITNVLVVVVFAFVRIAADPALSISLLVESMLTDGLLITLSTLASTVVGVGIIIIIVKARGSISIAEYLGFKSITKKTILILLAISTGFIILEVSLGFLLEPPNSSGYMTEVYKNSVWPVLFWITVVIFAPVCEETFFRGFLFAGLVKSRIGVAGTIFITALIWALLHVQYGAYEITTIFITGILLGIVRFKTKSLLSPLLVHAFINLVAMLGIAIDINGLVS
jgi:membrane protease YdiL (CAAX protease family)